MFFSLIWVKGSRVNRKFYIFNLDLPREFDKLGFSKPHLIFQETFNYKKIY